MVSSSEPVSSASASAPSSFNYPPAPSPDIIRAHQKDAYFQGVLFEQLSSLLRSFYGARFLHTHAVEARAVADALYLFLTTIVGHRTLGEEYTDLVQVEGGRDQTGRSRWGRLPSLSRRVGYVLTSILLPYALNRVLPGIRRRLRSFLERSLSARQQRQQRQHKSSSPAHSATKTSPRDTLTILQSYLLHHLDTITSPAPIYAFSLATFYFTGAYYHLSKRIFRLRYAFAAPRDDTASRAGYEVLGVLLVLQLALQAYVHARETWANPPEAPASDQTSSSDGTAAERHAEANAHVSLDPMAYSANNALLFQSSEPGSLPQGGGANPARLSKLTHTPVSAAPRIDLRDPSAMAWLHGRAARKCTLCLEPMRDPAATPCGHVFCWTCIGEWARERPECPLCRQSVGPSHILLLR